MFLSRYILVRWSSTIISITSAILIISSIYFICSHRFHDNPIITNFLSEKSKFLVIEVLLISPIFFQLILSWIYSIGYESYLSKLISNESVIYKKARAAQLKQNDSLIPDEYKAAFTSTHNQTIDTRLTNIDKELIKRLREICCNFNIKKIAYAILQSKNSSIIDDTVSIADENDTVDGAISIFDSFIEEYIKLGIKPKLEKFCKDNNLPYHEFREYYNNHNR